MSDFFGTFLNFTEFRRVFPGVRINFLDYLGIVSAIPASWKNKLRDNVAARNSSDRGMITVELNGQRVSLLKVRARDFYRMGLKRTKPTALGKWEAEGFSPDEWGVFFSIPYTCTKSTKLQSFQYQIIHRFTPTRKFLFVRKLVDSPICTRCSGVDTIAHHFYDCHKVAKFWKDFDQFVRNHFNTSYQLDRFAILFGSPNVPKVINLLIILGKHHIHSCSLQESSILFRTYLAYVKDVQNSEKQVAASDPKLTLAFMKKMEKVDRRWLAY